MLFRIKLMIIICASVSRMEVWPDYSFFFNLISLKLSELQILIKWDRFFFGSEHVRSVSSGFQFLHTLEHVRSLNNKWNKIDSTELTQSLVTQQSTIWRPQIRTKTNSWKKLEKYKNHNCMAWVKPVGYLTSVTELSRLPWTIPVSGHGKTWTRGSILSAGAVTSRLLYLLACGTLRISLIFYLFFSTGKDLLSVIGKLLMLSDR